MIRVTDTTGKTYELNPGQAVCGVGFTSVTIEFDQRILHPQFEEWFLQTIVTRLCPKREVQDV